MPVRAATLLILGLGAAVLAACDGHDSDRKATDTATVAFSGAGGGGGNGQSVSLDVPGFSAKLDVPGMVLGAGAMNLDGIAFHPGSRIAGMKITGAAGDGTGGEGHGTVEMHFTDPAAPDAVLGYYRQAARQGGWTEVPPAAGQQFAATKTKDGGAEHLAIQVGAAAAGSNGRLLVTGG